MNKTNSDPLVKWAVTSALIFLWITILLNILIENIPDYAYNTTFISILISLLLSITALALIVVVPALQLQIKINESDDEK